MIQTSSAVHSAASVQSSSEVTTSPFRQSEWDCRLDHLLQDLETSVVPHSQSSERTSNNISRSNNQNNISSTKVRIEVQEPSSTTADTGLRCVVFTYIS